jgi:hypothetical protein
VDLTRRVSPCHHQALLQSGGVRPLRRHHRSQRTTRHDRRDCLLESPIDAAGKTAWITSAFRSELPLAFLRVQAALYFDAPVGGAQQVLPLSPTSFAVFAQLAASPLYQALAPG